MNRTRRSRPGGGGSQLKQKRIHGNVSETPAPTMDPMKRILWLVAAAVLVIILAASVQHPPTRRVPKELVGEWHTTNPNYADRTFELDPVCITFTTGEDTVSVGFIKEVTQVSEGGRILYTISYTVDNTPNVVSFYYDMSKGNAILFKNQLGVVWRKDEES